MLLASGDPTIRETLAPYLQERLRVTVVTCGLGREALDLLAREPFDALLVAGALPDQAPVDLLAELRRRHPMVRRAIIAEHPTQRPDADQRGGAEAFFVKPYSLRRVESGLRELLAEPPGRAARRA